MQPQLSKRTVQRIIFWIRFGENTNHIYFLKSYIINFSDLDGQRTFGLKSFTENHCVLSCLSQPHTHYLFITHRAADLWIIELLISYTK